jgi:altronate dehydratase small subunit
MEKVTSDTLMLKAVIFHPSDNVATCLADLKAGEEVEIHTADKTLLITLADAVPFGHKFSLTSIIFNSPVIKYGEVIGLATANIQPGEYVHVHNVASARGRGDLAGGEK